MIKPIDIRQQEVAERILSIQIPSYQVEAQIIGFDGIPPLHDTVESLRDCGETFFVYEVDGQWAGAIAYEQEGTEATICRMMVHPDYFRRGIARQLLRHVLEAVTSASLVHVSTGAVNEPALALYRSEGFALVEEREVGPGVRLAFLTKSLLA